MSAVKEKEISLEGLEVASDEWIWVSSRTPENIEEASKITCTCVPAKKLSEVSFAHQDKCAVSSFTPWKSMDAEWVPALKKIVFRAQKGKNSTNKELIDDVTRYIIPKHRCWLSRKLYITAEAVG